MKVLIDLQACQSESRFRGIGRYAMSLVEGILSQQQDQHEFHFLLNGAFSESVPQLRHRLREFVDSSRFHVFFPVTPCDFSRPVNRWRREASSKIRQTLINAINPDCVFLTSLFEGYHDAAVVTITNNNSIPVFSVLYDLIPLAMKKWYLRKSSYRRFYLEQINQLQLTQGLVCISDSSAREVHDLLGYPKVKTVNIGAGMVLGESGREPAEEDFLLERFQIKRNFVLYAPGGFDERKNIANLFRSWAMLPKGTRAEFQLVIASKIPDLSLVDKPAKRAGVGAEEYLITGYVTDRELVALYAKCHVFIFPSLHEGFGLPVLEAMSFGAVVIGSNCTSIPEVIGNSNALFDPSSPSDIVRVLHRAIYDQEFRTNLREASSKQVLRFSWDRAARECLLFLDSKTAACVSMRTQRTLATQIGEPLSKHFPKKSKGGQRSSHTDLVKVAVSLAALAESKVSRLYVDISALVEHDAKTGIQRVVRSVLQELPKLLDKDYELVCVYGHDSGRFLAVKSDNVRRDSDIAIQPRKGDVFLGLDLSAHLFPVFTPEIQRFRAIGVRVFFVVYDIIPLFHPEFCDDGLVQAFRQWIVAIGGNSDGLFCISKSVADEVRLWLSTNSFLREDLRIDWFHLGADIESSKPSTGIPNEAHELLNKFRSTPTFLMVGTLEPRKGHGLTLDAFERLWARGNNSHLVMVGKLGWKMDGLKERIHQHVEYGRRLFWLNGVSDEYLDQLYSAAMALIAASVAEGFGLPIIEAAQKKVPVIARDIPVFREIGGDGLTYFTGDSREELAKVIESFVPNKENRIKWKTWKESTAQLVGLIDSR